MPAPSGRASSAGADVPIPDVCIPDVPLPSLPIPDVPAAGPLPALDEEEQRGDWRCLGDGMCPLRSPCGVPSHPGTRRGTLRVGGGRAALWGRRPTQRRVETRVGTRGLMGTPGRHGDRRTAVGRDGWRGQTGRDGQGWRWRDGWGRRGTRGQGWGCHRLLTPRGLLSPSASPSPRGSSSPGAPRGTAGRRPPRPRHQPSRRTGSTAAPGPRGGGSAAAAAIGSRPRGRRWGVPAMTGKGGRLPRRQGRSGGSDVHGKGRK